MPQTVRERLHAHLGEMLRRDVLPDFYSRGMAASVRAVALAALAQQRRTDPGTPQVSTGCGRSRAACTP